MGTLNKVTLLRLIFVGNGSDQTGSADVKSEKIKRNVACRLRRTERFEREVLTEIA